jgi:hypothetical protein
MSGRDDALAMSARRNIKTSGRCAKRLRAEGPSNRMYLPALLPGVDSISIQRYPGWAGLAWWGPQPSAWLRQLTRVFGRLLSPQRHLI